MNSIIAEFLFDIALMLAGYFFISSAIGYGIDYYFKSKNEYEEAHNHDAH